MESLRIERPDHLGIVAGVIKDLRITEMIDERIPPDDKENISTGEAIAGMILNGPGFSNRPLSLTPRFFENKPPEVLFRPGVEVSHFNHYKPGRSLEDAVTYGSEQLFSEIALSVCQSEGMDLRFNHLDTSSFSLTGDYLPDSDEQAVLITRGYSEDHRPDLKQAVAELMVSQDGGVPILCKCWDGNASDNTIFKKRGRELFKQFKEGDTPRYFVMDSKGYTKANAASLCRLSFITRVPATLSIVQTVIEQALGWDEWHAINEDYQYQSLELGHYGMNQRWLIVRSQSPKCLGAGFRKYRQKNRKRKESRRKTALSSSGQTLCDGE